MSWDQKAAKLRALHVKGQPLVLYNVWDAGSAKAVADAGAAAVATGSWSVAAAQGYPDGEALPMEALLEVARRISGTVDLPLSIDFEGGYAAEPGAVAENVAALAEAGAVGLNFEDQVLGGAGLYDLDVQVARIEAIRARLDAMVINARTDLFLKEKDATAHAGLLGAVLERGAAFGDAGADCFFVPGVSDPELIGRVCEGVSLPVNVMHSGPASGIPGLAALGVARISHGPNPYRWAMEWLSGQAQLAFEA